MYKHITKAWLVKLINQACNLNNVTSSNTADVIKHFITTHYDLKVNESSVTQNCLETIILLEVLPEFETLLIEVTENHEEFEEFNFKSVKCNLIIELNHLLYDARLPDGKLSSLAAKLSYKEIDSLAQYYTVKLKRKS
jgi:hypothetical protein